MCDIRETLKRYADDAVVHVVSCSPDGLVLSVSIPSRGGEIWDIRVPSPIHLDMNPSVTLGKVDFGGMELLPVGYVGTRNFDFGGRTEDYRVLKFTDVDDKLHYVVGYGIEDIVHREAG
jgi:hypothetical protein